MAPDDNWQPGGLVNLQMLSYRYRSSHYKDKTVSRPSYLYDGNLHTWKDQLYIEMGGSDFNGFVTVWSHIHTKYNINSQITTKSYERNNWKKKHENVND